MLQKLKETNYLWKFLKITTIKLSSIVTKNSEIHINDKIWLLPSGELTYLSIDKILKRNLDSNLNDTSPDCLLIVPSSWSIDISIFKPGGIGRYKNFVVLEVSGGIEKFLDKKLTCIRLFFCLEVI